MSSITINIQTDDIINAYEVAMFARLRGLGEVKVMDGKEEIKFDNQVETRKLPNTKKEIQIKQIIDKHI